MIVTLSATHAELCSHLHGLCFDKKWSLEDFENFCHNQSISIFGFMDNNMLAGFIVLSFIIDQAEIYSLCTRPDYRQQGIASRLFAYAYQECADRLMTEINLEVAVTNHPAIAFYQKQGFEIIATRKDYYTIDGQPVDALMMQL